MLTTLVSTLALVSGAASSQATRAPGSPPTPPAEGQAAPTVFEGVVLTGAGQPVPGALVSTTAGGRARTGAGGSFRLEVELTPGHGPVELHATRGALHSSVTLGSVLAGAANPAGDLTLTAGCEPAWVPTFGQEPGMDFEVRTLAVFDEGDGPSLIAGGVFVEAGSVRAFHVGRWNGWNWTSMGEGLGSAFDTGQVNALAVSGSVLYAGGDFESLGAHDVARWTGTAWAQLGSGANSVVHALASFDDGGGPELYAGGAFTAAGGVSAQRIARWNGASWSALAGGVGGTVHALAVFDDGGGPALYAGGDFTTADGTTVNRIARWDGASWSALGTGTNGSVRSLAVFDDGNGDALYVGGSFTTAGGATANGIARWDGASWSALAGGVTGGSPTTVSALTVFDDGSGAMLVAGGNFTAADGTSAARIARWDGASWSAFGNVAEGSVLALAVHDDGSAGGPALFAGGSFVTADGVTVERIARRASGGGWSAVGAGLGSAARASAVFDDGSGPALYVGGGFTSVGSLPANGIARWDGASWSALDSELSATSASPTVEVLAALDDGSGPALYAGGQFTSAGGAPANGIARWDGTSWSALGGGIEGGIFPGVQALAMFDDGSGPKLYAAGRFTQADGAAASNIASWDGTSWSPLGSGLTGGSPTIVEALAVFDDGSGPALYAGGSFTTAGGVSAHAVARWDGTAWSATAVSANYITYALEVFDDGSGPALYAGGAYGSVLGGVTRWDGTSWSALGGGLSTQWNEWVFALEVFDDGSGPALYAGGGFRAPFSGLARWNGDTWAHVGNGLGTRVETLTVFDAPDPDGPSLIAGGSFGAVPDTGDSYLARWQGCAGGGQPDARFGDALAAADVNGDGFSDVIVGEPAHDGTLADEGRVLVYLGSAGGLDSTPSWTRRGRQSGAHFGAALAGLDVNADGYGDVAIGAPGFDVPRSDQRPGPGVTSVPSPFKNSGLVVVFLGSASGLVSPPALFRPGIQASERLGAALARAGDVNGDGFDDVLVGAPGTDGIGAAFVFHGSSSGIEQLPAWLVPAPGGTPGTRYASAVGGGGDVNDDGFDDVVVGAPDAGTNEGGRAYVFHGSAAGLATTPSWDTGNQPAGDNPSNDGNSDWGASVAVIDDVNGNGRAEVALGNPHYDGDTINCCPVPIDIGAVKLFTYSSLDIVGVVETWKGPGAFSRRGATLSALGDVDADGHADSGIGDGHEFGGSLCVFGQASYWTFSTTLLGRGPISSAGDIDGDGFDDVVSADSSWGIVYVYRGTGEGLAFSETVSAP